MCETVSFHSLGEFDVCIDEMVAEATGFIAACYRSKERNSMSDAEMPTSSLISE